MNLKVCSLPRLPDSDSSEDTEIDRHYISLRYRRISHLKSSNNNFLHCDYLDRPSRNFITGLSHRSYRCYPKAEK